MRKRLTSSVLNCWNATSTSWWGGVPLWWFDREPPSFTAPPLLDDPLRRSVDAVAVTSGGVAPLEVGVDMAASRGSAVTPIVYTSGLLGSKNSTFRMPPPPMLSALSKPSFWTRFPLLEFSIKKPLMHFMTTSPRFCSHDWWWSIVM